MKKFDCGCSWPIISEDPLRLDIDIYKIPLNCPKTWELLGTGKTKGIFQLEEYLGKKWSKEIKPIHIEHLGALGALLRPGCLKAKDEKGLSTTDHFSLRRWNKEKADPIDDSVRHIMEDSFQLMIYQEHAIRIATIVAGFSAIQADQLRKAIGKKKADVMAKVKVEFLDGCEKTGILSKEKAEYLFEQIEKSQRYSFNKTVTLDTKVKTLNGDKEISEIIIGDKVLAPTSVGDQYVTVVNKYDHGTQDVYEVELDSGQKIKCTMDHKFLCSNGEILPLYEIIEKNLEIVTVDSV